MEKIQQGKHEFTEIFNNKFAAVYSNQKLEMVICRADSEYIPIDEFKKMFLLVSDYIDQSKITHFVFDKSNLRTFHQPSMEWYFAIWKPSLKAKGLLNHYKILPKLDWFAKSVEAGKHEILQKYGENLLKGIHVVYTDSVEEAIEKVENKN